MDQQKTLLGANQQLFQDQTISNNATRMQMNDIYDHQIRLEAAKLGTPQAQAAADAQHSQFAMQNAQLLQQNAMRGAVLNQMKQGGAGITPTQLGQVGFMPNEQATKEQASIDKQNQSIQTVQNIYAQMKKEQTLGNELNPQSYKRMGALTAQLAPLVQSEDPSKRLTPDAYEKLIKPFILDTMETEDTAATKMIGMMDLVKQAHAGETPYTAQYAPAALPKYPMPPRGSSAAAGLSNAQKYKAGDVVFKGGRKGIVQPNGDIKAAE